jgi:hypothetical protein
VVQAWLLRPPGAIQVSAACEARIGRPDFTIQSAGKEICHGLATPLTTNNPVKIAFHEWLKLARDLSTARSWRSAAACLLAPPRSRSPGRGAEVTP